MTDRELLELAAKAVNFQYDPTVNHEDGSLHGCFLDATAQERWPWNPLIDDGDALRLAAKLKLTLDIGEGRITATWYDLDLSETHEVYEYYNEDGERLPATRRAIVRAAAEIGKETP